MLRQLLSFFVLTFVFLPNAYAQFPDLTFHQVVHDADLIFVGTASKETSYFSKSGAMIYTDVMFTDIQPIHASKLAKQAGKTTITLTYPGGQVEDIGISVTEAPHFTHGQRYVLAMIDVEHVVVNPLIGGPQGQFLVIPDPATGEEIVLTASGHAITDIKNEELVLTPLPFGTEPTQATAPVDLYDDKTGARLRSFEVIPSTQPPLTLTAFIQGIEAALASPPPAASNLFTPGQSYALQADGSYKATPLPLTDAETQSMAASITQARTSAETPPVLAAQGGGQAIRAAEGDGSDIYLCSRFRNLPITMELQPESSVYHDEDPAALAYFNDFADMFRTRSGNRTAGRNGVNEFAAWMTDANLRHAYDYSWFEEGRTDYYHGPLATARVRWNDRGNCPRLDEADIIFNPNYSWTYDQRTSERTALEAEAEEDPALALYYYHSVVLHEIGHVVGLMTGGYDETYDYNTPTIMQGYIAPLIEPGHGLHAEDLRLIRQAFNHEPLYDVIDIGVEAYAPEAGFNPASLYDINTNDPVCEWWDIENPCEFEAGTTLWLSRITLENMSRFGSHDVLLSAYLSPIRGRIPNDPLYPAPLLMSEIITNVAIESYRTYDFGITIPNDARGEYHIVVTAQPLTGTDINLDNNAAPVLINPIMVTGPTVSGRVMRTAHSGLADVELVGFPQRVVTDAWGRYTVPVPRGWFGTASVEEGLNYEFTPETATFTDVISDVIQDFHVRDPQVSGRVLTPEGEPLADVHIHGFPQPVITDADGSYSISLPRQWHGSVTLEKAGYTFEPSQTTYGFRYTDEVTDYVGTAAFLYTPETLDLDGLLNPTIAWADFDNDGDLDFARMGSTADPHAQLNIYRQVAPFQFENIDPNDALDLPLATGGALAWGDFDRDGDLDLLITRSNEIDSGTQILRNDGRSMDIAAWTFSLTPLNTPFNLGTKHGAQWGDFDNDGDLDIALAGFLKIRIYRNDGGEPNSTWTFTELFTTTPSPFSALDNGTVEWGDYDRDGDLDLLLSGKTTGRGDEVVHLYRNDGTADAEDAWTFTNVYGNDAPWKNYTTIQQAHWGDFDNDGYLDLFFRSTDAARSPIFRSNRAQSFSEAMTLPGVAIGYSALGDFDNDGSLDIVLGGEDGGYVYKNHGFRFFAPEVGDQERLLPLRWGTVAPADINGDGRLDMVVGGNAGTRDNPNPVLALYRSHADVAGQPPAQPESIQAVSRNNRVGFAWDLPTDPKLKSHVAYNLHIYHKMRRIGTLLPAASQDNGYRQIVQTGNVNHSHFWHLTTNTWGWVCARVQAVSHAYIGSSFSDEACLFVVKPNWITSTRPRVVFDADDYGRIDLTLEPSVKPDELSAVFIPEAVEELPEGFKPTGQGHWVLQGYSGKDAQTQLTLTLSDKASISNPEQLVLLHYAGAKSGWNVITADIKKDGKTGHYQLQAKNIQLGGTFIVVEATSKIMGKRNATQDATIHTTTVKTFALEGAYPNPFNPTTQIRYSLPEAAHVQLQVFDLMGRQVATLVDGQKSAGHHAATFDASGLASGTYLYRLEAQHFAQVGTMVLLK